MENRKKVPQQAENGCRLRVNITLTGSYGRWAKEIKELGLVTSNHDLVNQAIKALYRDLTNERLKIARLKALEKAEEG